MSAAGSRWLLSAPDRPEEPGDGPALICLPHLGGNAAVFGWYAARLAPQVRVLPVQLPGHGGRADERPLHGIGEIVDAVAINLAAELRRPYVLYGHSLGALVVFELSRLMASGLGRAPEHLVVGACRAPDVPLERPYLHAAPEAQVIDYLRSMDGTPGALMDDADVRALVLPAVRADLEAWETYRFVSGPPLTVPITAIAGAADASVAATELRGWARQTTGPFRLVTVAGGHFFLRDAREDVAAVLASAVDSHRGAVV